MAEKGTIKAAEPERKLWGDQNEDGIDLARLRANLRLTPTERIDKLQAAVKFLYDVKRAAYAAGLRSTY